MAVATFLMLLWRDMYPEREVLGGVGVINGGRKWDRWGRPPGGFLDLGCVSLMRPKLTAYWLIDQPLYRVTLYWYIS